MGKAVIGFLLLAAVMLGCSAVEKHVQQNATDVSSTQSSKVQRSNQAYVPSPIDSEFPVPKQAKRTQHRSKNPNIRYVRYAFSGLMDRSRRNQYFTEIQKWGWRENKLEQMGSMHVFEKGEKRINLTIHPDFFTIFAKKEEK